MTEAEWLEANDGYPMLQFLEGKNPSQRKIHLFVCACCRLIHWDTMRSLGVQEAVLVGERFADGLATESELRTARELASRRYTKSFGSVEQVVREALWTAHLATGVAMFRWEEHLPAARIIWGAKYVRGPRVYKHLTPDAKRRVRIQCDLLRDLFAPFAASAVHPAWLAWNESTIPKIARAIYEERSFSDLPILADALEDAGCTDANLVGHCRGPDCTPAAAGWST
jgi:hypothetical protein